MYRVSVMSKTFSNMALFLQYFDTYEEARDWVEQTAYIRNHDCIIEYDEDEEGES